MERCPRCGADLETFTMWGREQPTCPECSYVGVSVDHGSDREAPESWQVALERFRERNLDGVDDGVPDDSPAVGSGPTDESNEGTDEPDGSAGGPEAETADEPATDPGDGGTEGAGDRRAGEGASTGDGVGGDPGDRGSRLGHLAGGRERRRRKRSRDR